MSIENFTPNIWAGAALASLNNALVYGALMNRDYEGLVRGQGDRVKINTLGRVTVRSYTKNTDLTDPEELTSAQQELVVDQGDYFNFQVDDVDRAQNNVDVMVQAMQDSAFELAEAADTWQSALLEAAIPSGNQVGSAASPKTDLGTVGNLYNYIVDLKVKLDENNTPDNGRWLVVPPWAHGLLLKDDSFINATETGNEVMRRGFIGMAAGFQIFQSNACPETSTDVGVRMIAGHRISSSFVTQILNVEAYRMEKRFADAVKGLNIYGGKVTRPSNLAMIVGNRPS